MNEEAVERILQEMQKNKDELKSAILSSEKRLLFQIENLKSRVDTLEQENKHLKNKLDSLEKNSKANNILLFGLDVEPKQITTDFVVEKLNVLLNVNVEKSHINNISCLGKSRNCPVKVEFISRLEKTEIFRRVKILKGSGVYIENDLTAAQLEEKKILRRHLLVGKENKKICFIKGNKLVIDGTELSVPQLLQLESGQQEQIGPTTPIQKLNYNLNQEQFEPPAVRSREPTPFSTGAVKKTQRPIKPVATRPAKTRSTSNQEH